LVKAPKAKANAPAQAQAKAQAQAQSRARARAGAQKPAASRRTTTDAAPKALPKWKIPIQKKPSTNKVAGQSSRGNFLAAGLPRLDKKRPYIPFSQTRGGRR
jgi:hypothetical protein